ncbi:hypothetical protein L2E82_45041 [Cichorium intybus]|uniref:Uncharacterized protein n=3 Tax=Cichorium intybus TaxID=13427 RepID=A0ACB8ZSF9_CICIN|nr:hypothetical protein L2E82_45038 [Cichorium intybus]KAI3700411.1 hypothetical protein L2E82_45039 [Cichorium intybus]KAI3700413.1 hypothetical protein L2E82_45041 [Cichorium intybus]
MISQLAMADQSMPVAGDPPPSAASHPITATPNAPQIQGAYYSNPYTSQQCATFVHRFFSILVGCISFTGIIIYIFWLIWVARIGYPEFRVKTLTLSNSRISSYYLIPGDCDVHFIIRNPNSKITLYYDQVQAVAFYKLCSLSNITLPPFMQGTKNETVIRAPFTSLMGYLYDQDDINGEKRHHGAIKLNVWMKVRVQFSPWGGVRRTFIFYCSNLPIAVSSKGFLDSGLS